MTALTDWKFWAIFIFGIYVGIVIMSVLLVGRNDSIKD